MGSTPGEATTREVEVELKGKKYKVQEPDLTMLGKFESYVKSKRLQEYQDGSEGVDPDEKRDMIKEILRTPISGEDMEAELTTLGGVRYMLYLALCHNPGVTLEGMDDIIDLTNLHEASAILESVGGEDTEDSPATEIGEDDADPQPVEKDSP